MAKPHNCVHSNDGFDSISLWQNHKLLTFCNIKKGIKFKLYNPFITKDAVNTIIIRTTNLY